jgi:hypothetical protein
VERLDPSASEEEAAAVCQTCGPENYAKEVHWGVPLDKQILPHLACFRLGRR